MNEQIRTLHHPLFEAKVLTQGAQLIHFQAKGEEPLLWSAKLETFEKGKAFRGGIPLCWPWFNKMGTPSHGFARIMEWELTHKKESSEGIELVFELKSSAKTLALWPYAFHAKVLMKLGKSVEVSLHVKADKESTGALHTYFRCKDVQKVSVSGLGAVYTDSLQEGTLCHSEDEALHVRKNVDRIYTQPEEQTLLCEGENTLGISHEGHSDVVVWNPWEEGAQVIADMHNDDYLNMLCIETAKITKPLEKEAVLHVRIAFMN